MTAMMSGSQGIVAGNFLANNQLDFYVESTWSLREGEKRGTSTTMELLILSEVDVSGMKAGGLPLALLVSMGAFLRRPGQLKPSHPYGRPASYYEGALTLLVAPLAPQLGRCL